MAIWEIIVTIVLTGETISDTFDKIFFKLELRCVLLLTYHRYISQTFLQSRHNDYTISHSKCIKGGPSKYSNIV